MLSFDYTFALGELTAAGPFDVAFDDATARGIADLRTLSERPLGSFLSAVDTSLSDVEAQAARFREAFTDLVVIGIGGSALGAKCVYNALVRPFSGARLDGSDRHGVRLHFIENVDPIDTLDLLEALPLETTAFNVITKSGRTVETMSAFFLVRERLIAEFGTEGYRARVTATTDPADGILRKLVGSDGLASLPVPPGVGGRFSVFTPVGAFPLAVAGLDVSAFFAGARSARDAALRSDGLDSNPAAAFATLQIGLYRRGIDDVVLMPYATSMRDVAHWFVQLWAESLGKAAAGPTPLPAVGATDQHSQLQLFMEGPPNKNVVFCSVDAPPADAIVPNVPDACAALSHLGGKSISAVRAAELAGVQAALREVGRPSSHFRLARLDEESLGALLMTLCAATGIAGTMLEVDPYDQPGVELAKKYAHGLLGRQAEAEYADRAKSVGASLTPRVSTI